MPVIIPAAIGLTELGIGLAKDAKAKKDAKELAQERQQNQYQISKQSQDELKLSESELAEGGLSAKAKQAYDAQNNAQLSSSLNTILKGGGNVSDVGALYGKSNEGAQHIAMLNDQLRANKIQNLIASQHNMADQEDKKFMYNIAAPERDTAQAIAAARTGAQGEISAGINTAGSALMSGIQNAHEEKMYSLSTGNNGGGYGSGAYGTQTRPDLGAVPLSTNSTMSSRPNVEATGVDIDAGLNSWIQNDYIGSNKPI